MCVFYRITPPTPLATRYIVGSGTQSNTATPSIAGGVTPDGTDGSLIMQFWGAFGDVSAGIGSYAIATSNPSWTELNDTPDGTTKGLASAWATRPEVTATGNVSCAGGSGTTDWAVFTLSIPPSIQVSVAESIALTDSVKQNISINTSDSLALTDNDEISKGGWKNQLKSGSSGYYNSDYNDYDALTDELSGNATYYDTDGEPTIFTNQPKT
jgi:hypothetical protein